MKRSIAMILALAMSLSLAACGQKEAEVPAASSTASSSHAQSSAPEVEVNNEVVDYYMSKANEVQLTDTHVIFTDDGSGEELTIEKNPEKVAVLFGSLACLWYEAGGTVQLAVGGKSASTTYKEQIGRDITEDEGVIVVTESSSGTSWDIEAILANEPDLIICSTGMKGYATISGPAQAAGIPVIGINYDAVQDYLKWFKVFCNLNGQPELCENVAEATANDIINIVSNVPEVEDAPTAIILVLSSDVLKAYTYDSQPGVMMAELGGVNLADTEQEGAAASVEISMEDIYALDPDMILLSEFGDTNLETLNELYGADPVWQELRAVKEGKLYNLEKRLFHNKANKNYNESYRVMAELLYPDAEF